MNNKIITKLDEAMKVKKLLKSKNDKKENFGRIKTK